MAYKFSVGAYAHSGSLSAASDITGSTTVSGAVGQFNTLTVATFSPATITTTSLTATTGSFTTVSGGFVDLLVDTAVPNWDNTNGKFSNSAIVSSFGGSTTISGSGGLTVTGLSALQAVTVTTLSASGDVQIGGNLTVGGTYTVVNSTDLYIKDRIITVASGGTDSSKVDGAGITLGSTGYNLKFVSGSFGPPGDSWQFSGSAGFTDFKAGNITATSIDGTLKETSQTLNSAGPSPISKSITFVNYSAGASIVTLPSASMNTGISYKVKNLTAASVNVNSSAGDIDGILPATGITLSTQYAAATFVSDGINWFVF